MRKIFLAFFVTLIFSLSAHAQELYPARLSSSPWHNEERELRYHPDNGDFVIVNGNRLFTRALYGSNTAFRVETGDRPEFALYMPGMGGNFRLGIAVGDSSKWLSSTSRITARYRAGSRIYKIEDPLLGKGSLELQILALAGADGFVIRLIKNNTPATLRLHWAFGGATGKKFSRDGDMGPDPESVFYLKPENCKDNSYTIDGNSFLLRYGAGLQVGQDGRYFAEDLNQQSRISKEQRLGGVFPAAAELKIADATALASPASLFSAKPGKAPVLTGRLGSSAKEIFLAIFVSDSTRALRYEELPAEFSKAEGAGQKIASRILVNTPDPYINSIGGALAIASDATWEAPSYLHGSIGWRMRLNGWRGAYTADVLGWHDRARQHLLSYSRSQVKEPASGPVVADTATHLSRSLEKLGVGMFTSGYISRDPEGKNLRAHHYDMNLVFIDILLRHYAWTGDIDFVKQTWPVIKRHLEWETRNFDADDDGLYDAYAAIWASDALQYSGGAVTHTSAYNYYAYTKAAELAAFVGEDPLPYRARAAKILKAMKEILWVKDLGSYAEFKDALGNRLLHTAPALWTIYHSMDSETMDPFAAYLSLRYIDKQIPHIPVRAKGLKDEGYYTLSTTNWMPYTWSLNNVALAESMHTALANWQGGRNDEAFKLFKSEILASMFLGGSPGNIVQISHYDASRKEAYRDFGDPVGMTSRALVEGLFGFHPDLLHGSLLIRPGLPVAWNYASFKTPDLSFDFKRRGTTDSYVIKPDLSKTVTITLEILARGQVSAVLHNGRKIPWKLVDSAVGKPMIRLMLPPASSHNLSVSWTGTAPELPPAEQTYKGGSVMSVKFGKAVILGFIDPQSAIEKASFSGGSFTATAGRNKGHYTVFLKMKQGALQWWMPLCFSIGQPVILIRDTATGSSRLALQNTTSIPVDASIEVNGYHKDLTVPGNGISDFITIPKTNLQTGTNNISIRLNDGTIMMEMLEDWTVSVSGKTEAIDISGAFNDRVDQIFRNKYLSPRPAVTTLQLPWQGTGDWPHPLETHNINDSGLRKLAGSGGKILLPQGISFLTPGTHASKNIVYTSQWDNYPREATIALSGSSSHAWLLMAGSTNPMQSRIDNGVVVVNYTDGSGDSLLLRNPDTWWPIEEDYYTDGFAFSLEKQRPVRIHLKTGRIVSGEESFQNFNGKEIDGGAATVLDLPLDGMKTLKSITVKAIANDVVIGLMAVTLQRD